jgi:predicted acyl esterase
VAAQYLAGEPYSQNPAFTDAGQQLVRWKSAYYQDALIARDAARGLEVPMFFVYGWTDQAVSPVQATSLIGKLKGADRNWPITLILADIGHTGQNKLSDWDAIHQRMRAFLDHYLLGHRWDAEPAVSAQVATCDGSSGAVINAHSLQDLATNQLNLASNTVQRTSWVPPGQPANYPLGCPPVPAPGTEAAWRWPIPTARTLVGLPQVRLSVQVTGTDADIMTRLWDVDPATGQRALVTRGVYKYRGQGGAATVSFAMLGAAWTFPAGHLIELEVAQDDLPLFSPDNLPSAVEYDAVTLNLPVVEAEDSGGNPDTTSLGERHFQTRRRSSPRSG